jgi:hypothetical protein
MLEKGEMLKAKEVVPVGNGRMRLMPTKTRMASAFAEAMADKTSKWQMADGRVDEGKSRLIKANQG